MSRYLIVQRFYKEDCINMLKTQPIITLQQYLGVNLTDKHEILDFLKTRLNKEDLNFALANALKLIDKLPLETFDTQEETHSPIPLWGESYCENSKISTDGFDTHDENQPPFPLVDEIHPQISHTKQTHQETMAILEKHFDTQEEIRRRNSLWGEIHRRNPLWGESYCENSEIFTDGFGTHNENQSSFYPMEENYPPILHTDENQTPFSHPEVNEINLNPNDILEVENQYENLKIIKKSLINIFSLANLYKKKKRLIY